MLRANRKGEFSAFLYMFLLVSRIRIKFVNFYKFLGAPSLKMLVTQPCGANVDPGPSAFN